MEDPLVQDMQAADVRSEDGNHVEALDRYVALLPKMQANLGRYDGWIPVVINSIGVAAYRLGKFTLARENFEIALRRVQSAEDLPKAADIFQNLCETAFHEGDAPAAANYCDRSRRLNARLVRKDRVVENLYWYTRALLASDPPDRAGADKALAEATETAKEAFRGDASSLSEWMTRLEATGKPEAKDPPDKVIQRVEAIEKEEGGPEEKAEYTDLLQFLLDDTKRR